MNINEVTSKLTTISDLYAKRFSVNRTDDWYLIKLQEELGELCAAFLKISNRGRTQNQSQEDLRKNLEDEFADVVAMTLLFAKSQDIDVEKALKGKWFKYLEEAQ